MSLVSDGQSAHLLTFSLTGVEVSRIPSLQEQPVQSAITVPPPHNAVPLDESLTVKGYAYSGGGRGIEHELTANSTYH